MEPVIRIFPALRAGTAHRWHRAMSEVLVRFLLGGLVVSVFAILGDVLRPKRFADLLSAVPSVALATLGIAVVQQGRGYAAAQGYSMIWGRAGTKEPLGLRRIKIFSRSGRMSKEKPGDDPRERTDWKSPKQTDEPWHGPVEKEQKPGGGKPDLERWHDADTH